MHRQAGQHTGHERMPTAMAAGSAAYQDIGEPDSTNPRVDTSYGYDGFGNLKCRRHGLHRRRLEVSSHTSAVLPFIRAARHIALVAAVDGIVLKQAALDSAYFLTLCSRDFVEAEQAAVHALIVKAYRWQYIVTGVRHPHFSRLLTELTTEAQIQRIRSALASIVN